MLLTRYLVALCAVLTIGCFDKDETPCRPGSRSGCPCRVSADGGLGPCTSGLICVDGRCEALEGPFGAHTTCVVTDVPSELGAAAGLSGIYGRYLFCSGIPIVAEDSVRAEALTRADETMAFLRRGNEEAFAEMNRRGEYFILRPPETAIGDLPEDFPAQFGGQPAAYWGDVHAGTAPANNILCEVGAEPFAYENLFIATFIQQMVEAGVQHVDPGFVSTLDGAVRALPDNEDCRELRSINNTSRYFGRITSVWFEAGHRVAPPGRGGMSLLDTRAELRSCDRIGAELVASMFGSGFDLPSCIRATDIELFDDGLVRCGNTLEDAMGERYGVVQIGNQCWSSQNFAATQYDNLTIIPSYGDNPAADAVDGRLYDHSHVTSSDVLCPEGWRVPSLEDTMELENYLVVTTGDPSSVAGRLRAQGQWAAVSATDATGFAARPSGVQLPDDSFDGLGQRFVMWTSTVDETTSTRAMARELNDGGEVFETVSLDVTLGASVRCMRD